LIIYKEKIDEYGNTIIEKFDVKYVDNTKLEEFIKDNQKYLMREKIVVKKDINMITCNVGIDDKQVADDVVKMNIKDFGVEMEGIGIVKAVEYANKITKRKVTMLPMCKAVSDIIESKDNENWADWLKDNDNNKKEQRELAIYDAAKVALMFLEYRFS